MQQWTTERARKWQESQPYIFGCNFLPSTAVNSTDMWQEESFDPATVERELQFAVGLGYNSVRVFVPYIVWESDPGGLLERMDSFLAIAAKVGVSMMPILFDDCAFAGREPYLGRQDDPVPGVHNSQWTPSPGFSAADDRSSWPRLEAYVTDLVTTFADDTRVLIWDLYNEPGNSERHAKSIPLLEASFEWARAVDPTQPLTAGSFSWTEPFQSVASCCEQNSDIVSFHSYDDLPTTVRLVDRLSEYGRPLLCTEWLHRPRESRFETHLPIFRERNTGIYNWGLVLGRTQTNLSWDTMNGNPNLDPVIWQHDVISPDGEVYSTEEIAVIREQVGVDVEMTPVEMTPETMQDLEDRGLIIRLRPGAHELDAQPGETQGTSLYEPEDGYGPHKLIADTVNREEFAGFGTHPDNEEFLLIGTPETKPMYLAVALCMREEFEKKIRLGRLAPSDLVLLRCVYNDPEVSFFVMRKDVPHGEAILQADLPPATFYVTESRDLTLDLVQMRKYRLRVSRT